MEALAGISPVTARHATVPRVTLPPDLEALGRPDLTDGIEVDELPPLLTGAVHEAGHAVARMHQEVDGGDLVVRADGSGVSHGVGPAPTRWLVPVLMAGVVAEAELAIRVGTQDEGTRVDVYDWGGGDLDLADLRRLPRDYVDTMDEAVAIELIRANWQAVLRVAAGLLAAPDGRLTWPQQVELAGTVVEADDETIVTLREQLDAGQVESLVARVHA